MKLNKTMLAVALGLSVASLSSAETIYLTGSTAMRSTIYAELTNAGTVFTTQPVFTGYGGKAGGDTYMAFYGTLNGGSGNTTINCFWSGSEAGILAVASNTVTALEPTFMDQSLVQTSSSVDNAAGTPPTITDEPANVCMADNAQSFSRTTTPSLSDGTEVGVITFKWVRNPGTWTGANVTDSQILQALTGQGSGLGGAKQAVFDGNAADTNNYVYVSGRDTSSGTRVNTLGDTGYGILTPVNQIELSGGVMQILATSTNRFGVVTTNYCGNFGFSSGGTLAGTMGGVTTSSSDLVHTNLSGAPLTGFSVIAYLGTSDATTATNDGGVQLTYNGVPFAPTNIEEGTYSFWGNEYCYAANNADATALQVWSLISTNTPAFCDGTIAIALPAMHSTRGGPTTFPVHN